MADITAFVMESEPLDEAALRLVDQEAGIAPDPGHLEQLGAYGDPVRDPRTRVVTVAYWAVAPLLSPSYFDRGLPENSTAIYAEFVPVPEIESGRLRLAFDHARIVADALDQVHVRLGDDHPRATLLSTRVHHQPAHGSVRGRLGDAARRGELSAQGAAERGVRGAPREVAPADGTGGGGRRGCGWRRGGMGSCRGRFGVGG